MGKLLAPVVGPGPIPGHLPLHKGKVRNTYLLPNHPRLRLVVATDQIGIMDFVLPAFVREKGAILTAMNAFWRKKVFGNVVRHDMVACGSGIEEYLLEEWRDDQDLMTRATVVRNLDMLNCRAIAQGHLSGSSLGTYREGLTVCGHTLPAGLEDGDELPYAIFTPSTKAKIGHDEHVSAQTIATRYGAEVERLTLQLFALARRYAKERGIILADTKLEWGYDHDRCLVLADEVLTPDSSRFWDAATWARGRSSIYRGSPQPLDKQYVRNWGKRIGIHERDPANDEDVAWVQRQTVPPELLAQTTQLYRYAFWRLTGMRLETFQRDHMGIPVDPKPARVVIISDGTSEQQMQTGLTHFALKLEDVFSKRYTVTVHVMDCHRRPEELRTFVREGIAADSVVVVGASKAAALPGIVKAHLMACGKHNVPVIGVAFNGRTPEDDLAARLAIERLPGQPVILDPHGKAYTGTQGFYDACVAALEHEFLPGVPEDTSTAR